ncbi:transposase [Acinetobacter sp. ANC 4558]|uniref:transposase n=1 Tax=Acinetobacter sp. ANC 4558 TaxID=1977876 RepID=UPI003A1038B2
MEYRDRRCYENCNTKTYKQKKSDSSKKKAHTIKVQAIIHYKTQKILTLCTNRSVVHDFERFKRNLNQIPFGAFILADKAD